MTESTIHSLSLPEVAPAFKAPARCAPQLLTLLDAMLNGVATVVLPMAVVANRPVQDGEILRPLDKIRRRQWDGAWAAVEKLLQEYSQQTQQAASALAEAAEQALRRERLEEQRTNGLPGPSRLYGQVLVSCDALQLTPPRDWTALLASLKEELNEQDGEFAARNKSRLGRGRQDSYQRLQAACATALRAGAAEMNSRAKAAFVERLRQHVATRAAALSEAGKALVKDAHDVEQASARAQAYKTSPISRHETTAGHDSSIPPAPDVVETHIRNHEGYFRDGVLQGWAFRRLFGAWLSDRGWLPGEDGTVALVAALRQFIAERAHITCSTVDLVSLYTNTGKPLPLDALADESAVRLMLNGGAESDGGGRHMRLAEIPEGLETPQLDTRWQRVPASDRYHLRLLQDVRGLSGWAFLNVAQQGWQSALEPEAALREASTQPLADAVRQRKIIERFAGRLDAVPEDDRQSDEPVSDNTVPGEAERPAIDRVPDSLRRTQSVDGASEPRQPTEA